MSIAVLNQVSEEVRRLAIAGSVVAGGDFRLKKLIAPLAQAGEKAPVFAKVAQAIQTLVDSSEQTSAISLLELSTLINAILYTQGETGVTGKIEPIESINLGQKKSQVSARVLKPLLEALTTTGSGRSEVVKEAFERQVFHDLRLVKPALAALDDVYAEIADFIATNVLPLYGAAILPELRAKFDHKGRAGHVRRLQLMHQLDPQGSREFVKTALEEGSKEIKVAAIECLGEAPEDLQFLLEQAKAKAKDVCAAALKALGKSSSKEAVAVLEKVLRSSEVELAVEPVRASGNLHLLKVVLEEAAAQLNLLLKSQEKDKKKLGLQVTRMLGLLECLRHREDAATNTLLLNFFGKLPQIGEIGGEPSGKDIQERLVSIMSLGPLKTKQALVEAHASLSEDLLAEAFMAAHAIHPPKKVFELFSPYLVGGGSGKNNKNKKSTENLKRQAILGILTHQWQWWHRHGMTYSQEGRSDFQTRLDPRWLDLGVQEKQIELVQSLARPGHAGTIALLQEAYQDSIKKTKDSYNSDSLLWTMAQIQHPAFAEITLALIPQYAKGKQSWGYYSLARVVSMLPQATVPQLEAMLPSLPDKLADVILDAIAEIKSRPK